MSNKKKVLIAQSFHPDGMALLEARDDVEMIVTEDLSEDNLTKLAVGVHAITTRNAEITGRIMQEAPDLMIVSRHGVGTDNIDFTHANPRKIPVAIAATANAVSVAEQVMMFLLALAKDAKWYDAEMRNDNFGCRLSMKAIDVQQRTLLIIGVGRIGRRVARLAKAFNMRVIGADPYLSEDEMRMRDCEPVRDWHAVLPEVDFVTVHTPKTPKTVGILSTTELEALPNHAIVINCARGGLIDEDALYEALTSGQIRGAGVDVFNVEPTTPDNKLLQLDNLLMSPHSAATTQEGARRMGISCAQSVLDYFDGKLDPDFVFNAKEINYQQGQ
jgi:D-3-phosphoglycerate dehydrogenase / 2-oxoglutarate reductase